MNAAASNTRIGLIFVHGIGEQKRFEHLLASASDLAELMLQANPGSTLVTTDRTADWKLPPGVVDPDGEVPLTLTMTGPDGQRTIFACREVWWADLGARSGLLDTIKFWLWALGQWSAPIYRLLDAAQTSNKPIDEPPITKLPKSVVGTTTEVRARVLLAITALCALMAALSWVLAKRVFSKLLGTAPSPTLIVQYVGDVHTYEERAAPGNTNLSDPGFPRRVAIRRRMITEMVAMATSNVDRWHVVAHSLGTVLAYNGLTEIGHTLPNYLPLEQWRRLPFRFKSDDNCRLRPAREIQEMMPARPPWLRPHDVVNRKLLFGKLKGVLTYGSPLDKFATLWPRIVATASDRKDESSAFSVECAWINYHAPEDPVAGHLDYYNKAVLGDVVPVVQNRRKRPGWWVGLAHILYFSGAERFERDCVDEQKREIARWLSSGQPPFISSFATLPTLPGLWLRIRVPLAYVALIATLWAASSAMIALLGGVIKSLRGASVALSFPTLCDFALAVWNVAPDFIGYLLTIVLLLGLLRWYWESDLNLKLLRPVPADPIHPPPSTTSTEDETKRRTDKILKVIGKQRAVAAISLLLGGVCVICCVLADAHLLPSVPAEYVPSGHFTGFAGAVIAIALSSAAQAFLNRPTRELNRLSGAQGGSQSNRAASAL